MGSIQKIMPENTEENMMVPIIGSGEIVDLNEMKTAMKSMTDQDLTTWFVKYHKPLREAVGMIRGELISRMVKNGSEVFHAGNGQRIELKIPPKRTCDKAILDAVQEKIKKELGQDLKLVRVKETFEPAMSDIKKARKLSMDIATAISEGLKEEPGNPTINIEGVDSETAKAFEPR